MLDTGFSYWLAINDQDIDALGWERLREQTMRTARGDVKFDIYVGQVLFDGEEFDIPVHVGCIFNRSFTRSSMVNKSSVSR